MISASVVWVMITWVSRSHIAIGPEFASKNQCERAALVIDREANDRMVIGQVNTPFCVRIEK